MRCVHSRCKLSCFKVVPGHGTKHAAAAGITGQLKNSVAILVSEESGTVKVFRHGDMVAQMSPNEPTKPLLRKIIAFVSDGDTVLLTAAGASTAILGPPAIPTVLVAGGAYLAIKTATGAIKKHWED